MKKVILLMAIAVAVLGFDKGQYKCGDINNYLVFDLKEDGTARQTYYVYPKVLVDVKRGYWKNEGDVAYIITNDKFIENIDGTYMFKGQYKCEKTK